MAALSEERITKLVGPYLEGAESVPGDLYSKLGSYLDLLLRWNARTNLTAIREPEEIVTRHFGESLFVGVQLQSRLGSGAELLDFGSGGGFPGVPVQLLLPQLKVCLAESQGKKASFLQEVVRTLALQTEVWSRRVEAMPEGRTFGCIALRAVDKMELAEREARKRLRTDGLLAILGSQGSSPDVTFCDEFSVPGGHSRTLYLYR